ncbi:MAG: Rrf2 family transcriptional regulator [Myxococcales bacterium]|jgi:Rrf2 family protein|nr:Rrf2 family transcriptional regulator [Myxococcales bacterium]
MLTMKTKYALKALALLANATEGEPVLIATIAEREDIPLKFLQLILRELRQHGVLRSRKGPGGGYFLNKPAESLSLSALIRILDGPIAPVPCLSKTAYQRCEGCRSEETCGIRLVLRDVHEATLRVLDTTTLADLARMTRSAESGTSALLRYSI